MADLTEFAGEDALRAGLIKKRAKAQEKLNALIAKAQEKIAPLQNQIEKFDALIAVLDCGVQNIDAKSSILQISEIDEEMEAATAGR